MKRVRERTPQRPRKGNPYHILGSKIRQVGSGLHGSRMTTVRMCVVEQSGRKRFLVKKVPLFGRIFGEELEKRLLREIALLRLLGRNKVKVPKKIKVDLRREATGLWMQDLFFQGELIETHESGNPYRFKELSLDKDGETIARLAQDLKTIHELGYVCTYGLDIWVFASTGKGLLPIVVDVEGVKKISEVPGNWVLSNIQIVNDNMKPREFEYFKKVYNEFQPKLVK